jgi:hypothetical protein
MALFLDDAVPAVLGRNLARFAPQYCAVKAFQPPTVHDFSAVRTKSVQLDRFKVWGEKGLTKTARRRDKTQLIGTANGESLTKDTKTIAIYEHTGPSDAAGAASTLHLTKEDMLFARQMLWQYGLARFHEAIGSAQLADDFQRWFDRVMILEAMSTTQKYNPDGLADGSTLVTSRIDSDDLAMIKYRLSRRNTPVFQSTGLHHGLISLEMMTHLYQDTDFKQTARAVLQGGLIPIEQSPLYRGMQASGSAVTGMPMQQDMLAPVVYGGFLLFPSNNFVTRTVNSLTAYLGLFFGPSAIGIGSGGRGPVIEVDSQTDFNRHFHFIWSWWGDVVYLLDDDDSSGVVIEARTFGTFA